MLRVRVQVVKVSESSRRTIITVNAAKNYISSLPLHLLLNTIIGGN